jgi:hypothetical protein
VGLKPNQQLLNLVGGNEFSFAGAAELAFSPKWALQASLFGAIGLLKCISLDLV